MVAAPGVLGNDTDVEGDSLTVSFVNGLAANVGTEITLASGAKVTLNANGSFTYKPNGAFESLDTGETATDSFTYRANDGDLDSDPATVTITITGVNDAPVAGAVTFSSASISEGQSTTATLAFSDVDGESHTCTFVWGDLSSNTMVTTTASDTSCSAPHTYADDDADDKYTVTVTVSDGTASASASADVTVTNVSPGLNTPTFVYNPYTGAATATIKYSDPGTPDVIGATFSWGDGTTSPGILSSVESTVPDQTGTFTATHTYALGCVPVAPSVLVTDDDGGSATHTYAGGVQHYSVAFQAPIQDGARNIVKQGNVIPVKLVITDCSGNPVLGKTLSIGYIQGDVYDDDDAGR